MVERRKYKRYPMPRGTFAILRNEMKGLRDHQQMSIGEIAMVLYKSEPEALGQITDISFGGVAFSGNPKDLTDVKDVELDLLMTEKGLYLHNIPYVVVSTASVDKAGKKRDPSRSTVLRFTDLDDKQKRGLRELLTHHVG